MNRKRKFEDDYENHETDSDSSGSVDNAADDAMDEDPSQSREDENNAISEDIDTTEEPRVTYTPAEYFLMIKNGVDSEKFMKSISKEELLAHKEMRGNNYLHMLIIKCVNDRTFEQRKKLLKFILSTAPELAMEKNLDGETPLCLACKQVSHHRAIARLLKAYPQALHLKDKLSEKTPLHYVASLYGRLKFVECSRRTWMYEAYYNPDQRDNIMKTSLKLVKLFIKNGADVNSESKCQMNPIYSALQQESVFNDCCKNNGEKEIYHLFIKNMLELLLKHGASLQSTGKHAIFYVQTEEQAKWIIEKDPSILISKEIENENSILQYFTSKNDVESGKIIILLLKNGLKPTKNDTGCNVSDIRRNNYAFSVIEELLKYYPEYNINSTNEKGETMLTQYGKDIKTVEKLLKMGADPTIVDAIGNTVLTTAAKGKDIKLIRKLLNLGTDPSKYLKPSDCILVPICHEFVMSKCKVKIQLELLKDILQHPQIQTIIMSESFISVIICIFDELFKLPRTWRFVKDRLKDIIMCILNSNENIKHIQITLPEKQNVNINNYTFKSPTYDFFGYIMNNFLKISESDIYISYYDVLNILIECGYSTDKTPSNCIPFLTILLLNKDKLCYLKGDIYMEIIKKGKNLESHVLQMESYDTDTNHRIIKLREELKIPDALLLAFIAHDKILVEAIVSHYWAPPLSLLMFNMNNYYTWLSILVKYGGIPNGTALFEEFQWGVNELSKKFPSFDCIFLEKYEFFTSPVSLQDLCKYKVRELVADKVTETHTSLPDLLHDLLPPLLRNVVIH